MICPTQRILLPPKAVGASTLVLVHPDAQVIPDHGGSMTQLGYRLIVHRDPSASVPDLLSPETVGVVFAAQLDSELPLQICQILAQGKDRPACPVFFWGPGGSPDHLNAIFNAGASDCFPETIELDEAVVRIAHRLRHAQSQTSDNSSQELVDSFNKRVRTLAHDLKNPLCVLYGYAQMAQMGHTIEPDAADDMVKSSQEIRERIDSVLAPVSNKKTAERPESVSAQVSA